MHTTQASGSLPWQLSRVALLALAVPLAAEPDPAAAPLVPDGGKIVQEGQRLDIYDAKSNRTGYGYTRPDGSVDVFNRVSITNLIPCHSR